MELSNWITIIWFIITILITIGTSARNYNSSKRLNNFTIYNQKRHEIYPKLYEMLFIIISSLNNMNEHVISFHSSEQFSRQEIESQIVWFSVPEKAKEELLKLYERELFWELDNALSNLTKQKRGKL